jgi:hypothetical protein
MALTIPRDVCSRCGEIPASHFAEYAFEILWQGLLRNHSSAYVNSLKLFLRMNIGG